MELPVQFFQSIIGIELAIGGALLFQVRYFEPRGSDGDAAGLPDPHWRLVVAVILGATIFGSLDGIVHGGGQQMAAFLTLGVALSLIPILIRVLPPLVIDAHPGGKRAYSVVTIIGLGLYVLAVVALIVRSADESPKREAVRLSAGALELDLDEPLCDRPLLAN